MLKAHYFAGNISKLVAAITLQLAILCTPVFSGNQSIQSSHASIISSNNQSISLNFELGDVAVEQVIEDGNATTRFSLPDEGHTYDKGFPQLPSVTRVVIVPPSAGLHFSFETDEPRIVQAETPPLICKEDQASSIDRNIPVLASTYPPVTAQMSVPFIIRGVRMVKVTTYPVRFDPEENTYLHYDNIETEIRFTNDEPVNPVRHPERRNRSLEFLKFIEVFALNGSEIRRDDPDRDQLDRKPGHYLIVSHEACLAFVVPFIEWRRKGGYKVEILTFNPDEARDPNTVLAGIQERYNAYIEQGIDPFDHILLVGDQENYVAGPRAQWVLNAPEGSSVWGGGPDHADYLYACLEGNDEHMDAAISRFPAGNSETLDLVVGRTLSYESEPFMEDPAWFTRGAVFTQHCGNNELTYWTPYLHTITRWGEEVLRRHGSNDIAVYDDMNWDQRGEQIHPFLRNVFNEGRNVIVGSGNTYQWRNEFQGVNDNVIFPIYLNFSEHSRMAGYTMFRNGNGDRLLGPVASTSTWGDRGNVEPICVQWLGLISAFMNHDMTLGWSRVFAVTDLESYFPNVEFARDIPLYSQAKTDFDFLGDPGIQAWRGVPQIVEAQLSLAQLSPTTSYVEVIVTDVENDEPVAGAKVSLYAPGDIPAFDNAEYVDYDDMLQMTLISDEEGSAGFHIDNEVEFFPGSQLNFTITGRDIRPFFGDVEIVGAPVAIEVANFEFVEVEGNEDDDMNPGETFSLRFASGNVGEENDINGVTAIVSSSSEWIEVDENEIDLGDIAAGAGIEFNEGVSFVLADDCPDGARYPGKRPLLRVEFSSGELRWESSIELDPFSPALVFSGIVGADQIPFDIEELDISIENVGRMDSEPLTAELRAGSLSILVLQNELAYPNIEVGELANLNGDLFDIRVNQQTVPGIKTDMLLVVFSENGFTDEIPFTIQVEDGEGNFPQVPDDYGYICFDDTDVDWDIAPDYEWIEISLNEDERDFNGELLGFEGESEFDIGEAIVLDLPFETIFYGEAFEQITVCTKGFVAMGNQPRITNYQASPLDRAMGGGTGMIAPFWGSLTFEDNTGVYSFYDEENARFIIEWYEFRHRNEDADGLTFQVILYDPDVWITESGDADILFQYQSIADLQNIRANEWLRAIPFAAVGISSPDGTTGINYSFNNTLQESSAPLEAERAILFSTGFELRLGRIFGTVTDFETGESIQGARVYTMHGFSAISGEEGNWEIPGALAEIAFSITCSAPGYNDLTIDDDLVVEDGQDLEINFELLHPEFVCSVDELSGLLQEDQVVNLPFELRNDGNGPLEWETEERWQGGVNNEPWGLLRQYPIGEIIGDSRLQGVVFINDRFYISGSNNREPQIYVLNREGELVNQYPQFVDGAYGIRDMTFDGEWIWGSVYNTIYAFTPEGELMREFDGPFNPNNNFAWDSDRELLWVSSTTSDLVAIDRQGNQVLSLRRRGLRTYGLCYYPEDQDGYPLYFFHKDPDLADQVITKMDPETNDTMFVSVLDPEGGGNPSGSFCSNQYDPQRWVFICVINNGPNDRMEIWQIEDRFEWFELAPAEGIVNAGESEELVLTLDATGIPIGFRFEIEMVFHHNAIGGEFILPISLEILGNERALQLDLNAGWNMVSLNVLPEDLDVRQIVLPLVENRHLIILKNGAGQFYLPAQDFCNIDGWDVSDGYLLKVIEATQIGVQGVIIPADQPIELLNGWNIAAYFPRHAVNAEVALAGIAESLILAKDGQGRFYLPELGFSNMGNLQDGQGYQYSLTDAVELIYQTGEELALASRSSSQSEHFGVVIPTGVDMSILLSGKPQMSGQEIGIFTPDGLLVGSGKVAEDGKCGIAVWGNDETTDITDGAAAGDVLSFILWDGVNEKAIYPSITTGESVWSDGSFIIGEITAQSTIPVTFGIHETYPNPTNGPIRLAFGLEMDAKVSLRVYDLSGRLVTTLVSGDYKTGNHQVVWNTDMVSSGLYIVKLAVPGKRHIEKIAVLK